MSNYLKISRFLSRTFMSSRCPCCYFAPLQFYLQCAEFVPFGIESKSCASAFSISLSVVLPDPPIAAAFTSCVPISSFALLVVCSIYPVYPCADPTYVLIVMSFPEVLSNFLVSVSKDFTTSSRDTLTRVHVPNTIVPPVGMPFSSAVS